MRGEDSFVLWTYKRKNRTSKVETQEGNKPHKGGSGLWVAVSIRYKQQMRPRPSGIQAFKSIDLDQQQEGRKRCSLFVGADKRGPVVLNKRVWEFFFADRLTEKCSVLYSSEGVFLSPLPHTNQPCRGAEPGKMGKEGFLSQSQQMAAEAPFAPLPRSSSAGRTRAAVEQSESPSGSM